jgi:hypothetical protein
VLAERRRRALTVGPDLTSLAGLQGPTAAEETVGHRGIGSKLAPHLGVALLRVPGQTKASGQPWPHRRNAGDRTCPCSKPTAASRIMIVAWPGSAIAAVAARVTREPKSRR